MAWVTRAQLTALGDAGAAALLSNTTSLTRAALRTVIDDLIAAAVAANPAVAAAAQTAAQAAVATVMSSALYNRGNLANGTDLNTLYGAANNGIWSLPSSFVFPNAAGQWAARLKIESTTNNTTEQTMSRYTSTEQWRRVLTSTTGPTWTPWARVGEQSTYRGYLPDAANWNQMFTSVDNGKWIYTIPQIAGFQGTLPPITQHGILEITSQSTWQAEQKLTETRTNNVYTRTITNPSGPVWTAWSLIGPNPSGASGNRTRLSRNWLHVGDSLTDDVVLGTSQWPAVQATLDGALHEIRGWYNQESFEIAVRMGAQLYPVTVSGNSIPATAAVTVTGQRPDQLAFGGYTGLKNRRIYGWLADRYGYLQNPTDIGSMVFTPTDGADTATTVSGRQWFQGDMDDYLNRIVTIWMGANDLGEETPEQIVRLVRSMVARVPHGRVMVFTITGRSTFKTETAAVNAALLAAFSGLVFNTTAALTAPQAATDAGITFTAQDNTDIAAGIIPSSFRSDGVHLNANGAYALARAVHREAVARGYSMA